MELVIDVGNSYTKFAFFNNDKIIKRCIYPTNKKIPLTFLKYENFNVAIISSVVKHMTSFLKRKIYKINKVKLIDINNLNKKIGMKINCSKEEIGGDLFADLIAAKKLYKSPCIIFDIGTVSKVLALDKHNNFIGANFFAGLDNAKKALFNDTDALPNVDLKMNDKIIGKDTFECINNGIIYSTIYSINGFIKDYKKILGTNCKVIVTGGGSNLIKNKLNNLIINLDLTLLGIHYIYKENL